MAEEDLNDDSVWSKDIDEAFEEALAIYPPCGRRKIILSDEGKMYGRNELIARYIKMRTGKIRTRKQVSSHIQVLARKKQRELSLKLKHCDENIRKTAMENLATMSSAQIVSATMGARAVQNSGSGASPNTEQSPIGAMGAPQPMTNGVLKEGGSYWAHTGQQRPMGEYGGMYYRAMSRGDVHAVSYDGQPVVGESHPAMPNYPPQAAYQVANRPISATGPLPPGHKLCLTDFDAFLEQSWEQPGQPPRAIQGVPQVHKHSFVHLTGMDLFWDAEMECVDVRQIYDKFPGLKELYQQGPQQCFYLIKFWADINYSTKPPQCKYLMTSRYDATEFMSIQCSSRVCSFGKQVVEKIQQPQPPTYAQESGLYVYRFSRTPICEYMVTFVEKLKNLETIEMMNSVLENFSVLQVTTDMSAGNVLFCLAFVFEVSTADHGSQHHIYKLVDD